MRENRKEKDGMVKFPMLRLFNMGRRWKEEGRIIYVFFVKDVK